MRRTNEPVVPGNVSTERRSSVRFPIIRELRYTFAGYRAAESGEGRTVDLSSSGLSFTADRALSVGQELEVAIDWPALLGGEVKLQLIIFGVIVRTGGDANALKIHRYEFKTRGAAQK